MKLNASLYEHGGNGENCVFNFSPVGIILYSLCHNYSCYEISTILAVISYLTLSNWIMDCCKK